MMQPTQEQQAIIEASTRKDLVINALAGAAKTTTLEWRARAHPQQRILYIAFSKEVEQEAKRRFPANVLCRTTHGLAFKKHGVPFVNGNKLGEPQLSHLQKVFRMDALGERMAPYGAICLATVRAFIGSADPEVGAHHVPTAHAQHFGFNPEAVLDHAQHTWTRMKDPADARIRMSHDGYLKLFQLSRPQLHERFDAVFLDEAQDTNAAVFAIIQDQEWVHRVLVGDNHQAIYAFRGATDVLRGLKDARELQLTGSFRFGPEVAALSNRVLANFLSAEYFLRGLGPSTEITDPEHGVNGAHGRPCYLHRTNARLFDRAVQLLHKECERLYWIGGIHRYGLHEIANVFRVHNGEHRAVQDPILRSFANLDEMEAYARLHGERELRARIDIVRHHGAATPRYLEALRVTECRDPGRADAFLGTAHRAKGKEFDHVILGEDFAPLMFEVPGTRELAPRLPGWLPGRRESGVVPDEEVRINYVALTRARKRLQVNTDLARLMTWTG